VLRRVSPRFAAFSLSTHLLFCQDSGLKDGELPNEEHLRAGGFQPIDDVDLEAMERELNEL
jgi:hypothetical protein